MQPQAHMGQMQQLQAPPHPMTHGMSPPQASPYVQQTVQGPPQYPPPPLPAPSTVPGSSMPGTAPPLAMPQLQAPHHPPPLLAAGTVASAVLGVQAEELKVSISALHFPEPSGPASVASAELVQAQAEPAMGAGSE